MQIARHRQVEQVLAREIARARAAIASDGRPALSELKSLERILRTGKADPRSVLLRANAYARRTYETAWVLASSYAESNQSSNSEFQAGTNAFQGQVFQAGAGGSLRRAAFYMRKVGTPTSMIRAALYASSGALGTANATGAALAVSPWRPSVELPTSFALTYFDFPVGQRPTLNNGTNYAIVIETDSAASFSHSPSLGVDGTPAHPGNGTRWTGAAWAAFGSDVIHYVYVKP